MSLVQQLQEATIATDQPLAALLRRTMLLAARLENPLLSQWAHSELNGYTGAVSLPPYRRSRPVVVRGYFVVHGGTPPPMVRAPIPGVAQPREQQISIPTPFNDVPISPEIADPADRSQLFAHEFLQPVAIYEDWLQTQTGDMRAPWPPGALDRYRGRLEGGAFLDAWQVLSRADLIGVVDGVRNRLLDLALELGRTVPDAGERPAPELPLTGEQLTNTVRTIIYGEVIAVSDNSINVQGTAANVVGGQQNRVQQGDVSITQQSSDLEALIGRLRAAVEELDGQVPAEQLDATRGLVQDLEEQAAAPEPTPRRMVRTLKAISAIAGATGGAGAAVVDAVQAIQRALGS